MFGAFLVYLTKNNKFNCAQMYLCLLIANVYTNYVVEHTCLPVMRFHFTKQFSPSEKANLFEHRETLNFQ